MRDMVPTPGSAAGRGARVLPRLLEPEQPHESAAVFICQKQRKKVSFLFKKKWLLYTGVNVLALTYLCALT